MERLLWFWDGAEGAMGSWKRRFVKGRRSPFLLVVVKRRLVVEIGQCLYEMRAFDVML